MEELNSHQNPSLNLLSAEHNPHPVLKVDKEGKILYANPASDLLLRKLEITSESVFPDSWKRNIQACLISGERKEFEMQAGNLIFSLTIVPFKKNDFAYLFCFNCSGVKAVQERLHESDENYRLLAEFSADIISHYNLDGVFLYVSPAIKNILGYEGWDVLGKYLFDLIHPDDMDEATRVFSSVSSDISTMLIRMKKQSGDWVWIENRLRKFYNKKFRKEEIIGISRDVSERVKQELLIKESEERFRGLLEASREGIVFHQNGIIVDANEKMEELSGYKLEEIIGRSIFEFIPAEEHGIVMEKIKNKDQSTYNSKIKNKDGKIVHVEVTGKMQIYKGAEMRVVVLKDITQRVKAEEQVRRQQFLINTIMDNLPINIYLKDREGKYHFINQHAELQLGISREKIIGKTYKEVFPDRYYEEVLKGDECAWKNGIYSSEESVSIDNVDHYFLVGKFILNFESSQESLLLGYSIDITDRRISEENLKKAKMQLEESIKAKERFISIMSHEIRTPMNAVVGITNLLLQQVKDNEQKEYFNALKISSENLLKILNNVLDLSKIDSGKVSFEEIDFNLSQHLRKVKELFAFKAAEKNLKVKIFSDPAIPDVLKGDPHRLSQILVNLLSNSLKFTEEGEIRIEARVLDESKSKVHILFTVEDTGIGIPENKQKAIFESFSQADSDITRKYGGTGLGLTITKKLVELQGGRIGVESQPGKGSKFMFDLFFNKSVLKAEIPFELDNVPDFAGLRVLVVEDNSMNQLVVSKFLERKGVQPVIAEDGKKAIDILKEEKFDLVLMDLQMPQMDGYQASRYIRENLNFKDLPIIAFTASSSSDIERKVMDAGMNDYIVKPFEPSNFYSIIAKHTGRKDNTRPVSMEKSKIDFKYINLNYLKEASGNNKTFIEEMIRIFVRQTPETLSTLEILLDKKDWEEFKKVIHKMKPTVSMMGIRQAESLVKSIEKKVKASVELDKVGDELKKLTRICDASYEELKQELSS